MTLVQNSLRRWLVALVVAYTSTALGAPTVSLPTKPNNSSVVQTQTDQPVDCTKTPKDPSCKK